jgi:hypothetical protein
VHPQKFRVPRSRTNATIALIRLNQEYRAGVSQTRRYAANRLQSTVLRWSGTGEGNRQMMNGLTLSESRDSVGLAARLVAALTARRAS